MIRPSQAKDCAFVIVLLVLVANAWYANASPRCTPATLTVGRVTPADAVLCVGEPVHWDSLLCFKPLPCGEGYVRPTCFWDVSTENEYSLNDPDSFPNGWCATLTLSGPPNRMEGGDLVFTAPGPGHVTASCREENPGCLGCSDRGGVTWSPTQADFSVVGGDYTVKSGVMAEFKELRYYCGAEIPGRYMAMLTAAPDQPNGVQYLWSVQGHARFVQFGNTSEVALLEATAGSSSLDDITVTLTYTLGNHTCIVHKSFTAYAPSSFVLVAPNGITHLIRGANAGFETIYKWKILNQFGDVMRDVDFNEVNAAKEQECPDPYDWTLGYYGADHTDSGEFWDHYIQGDATAQPTPQIPQDPLGTENVDHFHQNYFAGTRTTGAGCSIGSHQVRRFRDHAEVIGAN